MLPFSFTLGDPARTFFFLQVSLRCLPCLRDPLLFLCSTPRAEVNRPPLPRTSPNFFLHTPFPRSPFSGRCSPMENSRTVERFFSLRLFLALRSFFFCRFDIGPGFHFLLKMLTFLAVACSRNFFFLVLDLFFPLHHVLVFWTLQVHIFREAGHHPSPNSPLRQQ